MPDDKSTIDPQTGLPLQEANQPDPMLQLTTGHLGVGGITIAALAIALILGVVFYGLNEPGGPEQTAAASAPHSMQPAAGGKASPAAPTAPRANESGVKG